MESTALRFLIRSVCIDVDVDTQNASNPTSCHIPFENEWIIVLTVDNEENPNSHSVAKTN